MSTEVLLTPEEQLKVYSDAILSSVIRGDDLSKKNRQHLFGTMSPKIFRDENHVLYGVLHKFKEQRITPDEDFYKRFLLRNEKFILNSKGLVNLSAYADQDDNPAVGYITAVIKQYKYLLGQPVLDEDAFSLILEKYRLEFKNAELGDILGKSRVVLYDGFKDNNKYLQGYDDSLALMKKRVAEIESLVTTTSGAGFVDASELGMSDEAELDLKKIGDFGELRELNKILGGIYTGLFYSVTAPTKGGKSKFVARMIHNIVVENGHNVVIWPHEGGLSMFLAQLRAIHFDYVYNRLESDVTKMKMGVNQNVILTKTYPSEAVKELEQASRTDLFTNPAYGKMTLIDRPFHTETFIDEIETAVQLCDAKAVVIDYLQLITSQDSRISKSEAIGKAYQAGLAYCKKRNIAFISPAQFKQEFIKDSAKSKSMKGAETRIAGGESSEVIRTPDINIGLYATPEDLENNRMQIVSIPSRLAVVFSPIEIYCDLGTCMFSSLEASDD